MFVDKLMVGAIFSCFGVVNVIIGFNKTKCDTDKIGAVFTICSTPADATSI